MFVILYLLFVIYRLRRLKFEIWILYFVIFVSLLIKLSNIGRQLGSLLKLDSRPVRHFIRHFIRHSSKSDGWKLKERRRMLDIRCSFNVRHRRINSKLARLWRIQRSKFSVQRSKFSVQSSAFSVQSSASRLACLIL